MKYLISERQYNLLSEQPDSRMPFQPETFGYNPKKPETTKAALQKQKEFFKKRHSTYLYFVKQTENVVKNLGEVCDFQNGKK